MADRIADLAWAIAMQESDAGRLGRGAANCNPGNLRPPNGAANFWQGQTGVDARGFAIFGSMAVGWAKLESNLRTHCRENPNQTLGEYIASYAPASDGNEPVEYAQKVAARLGVDTEIPLKQLLNPPPAPDVTGLVDA